MIFISHDLAVVAQVCEKAMIMYAGEIIEQGCIANIFQQPKHPYSKALLLCTLSQLHTPRAKLPSIPASQKMNESSEERNHRFEQILTEFNSQKKATLKAERPTTNEESILRITGLHKSYPLPTPLFNIKKRSIHAVKNISLTLRKGQTLGLSLIHI